MALRMERGLDAADWRILQELQADARLSFNELGRRIHLSAPSVAERVRHLEDRGILTGYHATVDPSLAGHPVTAFLQMRCDRDRCLLTTSRATDYPEVCEIHKLSGDYCSLLKVRATSMEHLEGIIEQIGRHGQMRTSIVLSTQFERRPVGPPPEDFVHASDSEGWAEGPREPVGDGS
ncbi:MAG: Lrp/AsnC family transcriptional regulator [Candidatus Dormibacteraceae bacterium]